MTGKAAFRYQTFLLSFLLAIAPAAGMVHAAPATDALLAEVQQALDMGDASHAVSLADNALAERGVSGLQRGRLLLDRGLAKELLGSHDDAMIDFTMALGTGALPPGERAQVLLQRGFLLDSEGKLDDAAGDYSAVIRLAPDLAASALNNRANIYRRQNRLEEARRDYRAALAAANPHPEYPYAGLGQVAEAQGDTEVARGFYARAATANPHYALAVERLAALGGPPAGAILDPDAVHLKPLPAKAARTTAPVMEALPDAALEDATVHLHMPRRPGLRPAMDRGAAEVDRGSGAKGPLVQLGAWRSLAEAQQGWKNAAAKAGGGLNGLAPVIVTVDLPGLGRYFRLRTTPGKQSPQALCSKLTARGVDCLPVRN